MMLSVRVTLGEPKPVACQEGAVLSVCLASHLTSSVTNLLVKLNCNTLPFPFLFFSACHKQGVGKWMHPKQQCIFTNFPPVSLSGDMILVGSYLALSRVGKIAAG